MSDMHTRQRLLASAERHEEELEQALSDLGRAVARPFAVGRNMGAHIARHPLPWLAASLLVGVWLAARTRTNGLG
jgi:hypothetical protein